MYFISYLCYKPYKYLSLLLLVDSLIFTQYDDVGPLPFNLTFFFFCHGSLLGIQFCSSYLSENIFLTLIFEAFFSSYGILVWKVFLWFLFVWPFSSLKVKMKVKSLSCVQLFSTLWTVAYHFPLSMGFSRQEYWSGLPCPSLGDLPDPGIKPRSPTLQAHSLPSEPPGNPF